MGLYEVLISVCPAVDDCQLSLCVEKQCVALTGKLITVLLNITHSKMYFSHLKEGTPKNKICFKLYLIVFGALHTALWHYILFTVQRLYSYAQVQLLYYTVDKVFGSTFSSCLTAI